MSQAPPKQIMESATPPGEFGAENPVLSLAERHSGGDYFPKHNHDYCQLICTDAGMVRITTDLGSWAVPPQRAVWIPANTEHDVLAVGAVEMRTVCVLPDAATWLANSCMVVELSDMLRALINELARIELGYPADGKRARMVAVFLDQLDFKPLSALHLPFPTDKRIQGIADALLADPSDRRTLNEWARVAGGSSRTLSRLFQVETGMSFRDWRLQLHMHEALAKLANKERVTEIAFDLGYNSPSAFIAIFGKTMGQSPLQYMQEQNREDGK